MDHEELAKLMSEFKESRGWKEMQEWLSIPLKGLEYKILNEEQESLEIQNLLKRELTVYKRFYNFPDYIVEKSSRGLNPLNQPDPDPYE